MKGFWTVLRLVVIKPMASLNDPATGLFLVPGLWGQLTQCFPLGTCMEKGNCLFERRYIHHWLRKCFYLNEREYTLLGLGHSVFIDILILQIRKLRHHESRCLIQDHITKTTESEPTSVAESLSHVCLRPHGLQYTRLSCPSLSPRVCLNSCPLNRWCHPTTSFSIVPFSSCLQSSPVLGSFPISQLLSSCG